MAVPWASYTANLGPAKAVQVDPPPSKIWFLKGVKDHKKGAKKRKQRGRNSGTDGEQQGEKSVEEGWKTLGRGQRRYSLYVSPVAFWRFCIWMLKQCRLDLESWKPSIWGGGASAVSGDPRVFKGGDVLPCREEIRGAEQSFWLHVTSMDPSRTWFATLFTRDSIWHALLWCKLSAQQSTFDFFAPTLSKSLFF